MVGKNSLIREWDYLLLSLLLGLILLPCVIDIISAGAFHCVKDFYMVLMGAEDASLMERTTTWAIAMGPYLFFQVIRAAVWMVRHSRQ